MKRNKMFPLKGVVQHYSWGGSTFLPSLLGIENPNHEPFAEYWLGAHEKAPSTIENASGESIPLHKFIEQSAAETLGDDIAAKFHRLPYLLKILDVKEMLSIQVHPAKKQAEAAFKKENESGIPLDAPNRNYKDDNHKPELMVALSEFWLLHGFKKADLLTKTLQSVKELKPLLKIFSNKGYEGLYRHIMEMPQEKVNEMLQPLLKRIIPAYHQQLLKKDNADFWAARAAQTFNVTPDIDRGIFSIYFFNLVQLHPGEAVYQAAGIMHAYLEGQNVEIMANSDNVLRGGLTPKHVDVQELMKQVKFKEVKPVIIKPRSGSEKIYSTPAEDFELSRFDLKKNESVNRKAITTEIILNLEGEILLKEDKNEVTLKAGEAAVLFTKTSLKIKSNLPSQFYIASVPVHKR